MSNSQDDQTTAEYQNELSKTINDGGSCAETGERLQQLRSERDGSQTTRRNVLRTVGAAGLSLAGVSTASAKGVSEHNQVGVSLTKLVAAEEIQTLLKSLGHPQPKAVHDSEFEKKGPVKLSLDSAETEVVEANGEEQIASTKITRTTIPSNAGELVVVKINNDVISPVFFKFHSSINHDLKKRLDLAGKIGWPTGVEAALVGTETQAVFRRETATAEQKKISRETGTDPNLVGAFAQRGQSGYSAVETSSTEDSIRYVLDPNFEIQKKADFHINEGGVTTQQNCDIGECLSVILFPLPAPCGGCGYICLTPIPGVSQAACLVCLLATCGAYVLTFAACVGVQDCV